MNSEEEIRIKVRKALQLLLLPKVRAPGVKGWELKRTLGKDYKKVLEVLSSELERIGLTIKVVNESGEMVASVGEEELDNARYYIIFKEGISLREASTSGMSVDDMAALAIILSYLTTKHGKAPVKEVEKLLKEKLPKWKVEWNIRRFIRKGYLNREGEMLLLGWRSLVEVDLKSLLNLILATSVKESSEIQ
ncbi:MAG: hypothetical protein N3F64_01180 [Nitrososphaeria archaeon]|nr:hypothetical protein [Nitrososphaeria archaeon]